MSLSPELTSILQEYPPISLEEAELVKLQDRKDTKYVLSLPVLENILRETMQDYRVFEIDCTRVQTYQSIYFDTPQRNAYLDHHNGHLNRSKIRIRDYMESEMSYFELKKKDNHRRTIKTRSKLDFLDHGISDEQRQMVEEYWKHDAAHLEPALVVQFHRIMLANLERNERVTIDIGLDFELLRNHRQTELPGLVVVEVKRPKSNGSTPMQKALKNHHVPKSQMSKYCVGTALLDETLKNNRFKPLLRNIMAISGEISPATSKPVLDMTKQETT